MKEGTNVCIYICLYVCIRSTILNDREVRLCGVKARTKISRWGLLPHRWAIESSLPPYVFHPLWRHQFNATPDQFLHRHHPRYCHRLGKKLEKKNLLDSSIASSSTKYFSIHFFSICCFFFSFVIEFFILFYSPLFICFSLIYYHFVNPFIFINLVFIRNFNN